MCLAFTLSLRMIVSHAFVEEGNGRFLKFLNSFLPFFSFQVLFSPCIPSQPDDIVVYLI